MTSFQPQSFCLLMLFNKIQPTLRRLNNFLSDEKSHGSEILENIEYDSKYQDIWWYLTLTRACRSAQLSVDFRRLERWRMFSLLAC